jgi:epoxyqueuosine reductase
MKRVFLPIERLTTLQADLRRFHDGHKLNGYQEHILNTMYDFSLPAVDFTIRSVCIVATPIWARQNLSLSFKDQDCVFPVPGGRINPDESLKGLLAQFAAEGTRAVPAESLPNKRLAVCSGLAVYGRNNIAYIEGMGSYFYLELFYTNQLCDDPWRDVAGLDGCSACNECIHACPTQTILADRFLIDNERCLTTMNQGAEPNTFPEWVDPYAHNCVHNCLICQSVCPKNEPFQENIAPLVSFTEVETRMLICAIPYEWMGNQMRQKIDRLELKPYLAALPRNIKALLMQRQMV